MVADDLVFKTLWYRYYSDPYIKEYLNGIIESIIGHSIDGYTLGPNETGIMSYKDIANRLDISLINENENAWLDVEMNYVNGENTDRKSILATERKSEFYLTKVYNNAYNKLGDRKYQTDVKFEQVNLDCYYSRNGKEIEKEVFVPYDIQNKIEKDWFKEFHLYLPRERDLCYSLGDEERKNYTLMICNNKEEREKLSKNSKTRKRIVEILEELERDEEFMSIKDQKDYEKALRDIALENGIEQGKEKGKIEMIKSLYTNKVDLKVIASSAGISIKSVKNILGIN